MNRRVLLILCCLLRADILAGTLAGADTLYGVQAPTDAAFVRVFRAVEAGGALEVGARRFDPPRGGVTPYRSVLPDIYLLRSGSQELELIPQVRHYYTVALTAAGSIVFEDVEHTDPARAQLVLYNLLPGQKVELKTADGRTPVIAAVGPGEAGRINVNAVPVRLGVFGAAGPLAMLGDPALRRGASYSVFVFPGASGPEVLCAKAELAKD
jgi:alginate O-acetyltransferase complex protein AlgF